MMMNRRACVACTKKIGSHGNGAALQEKKKKKNKRQKKN